MELTALKTHAKELCEELECTPSAAPYPYIPKPVLKVLGFENRCSKLIEIDIGKIINPLDVKSFVTILKKVSKPFTDLGLKVVGILDPFWAPYRHLSRLPLVLFRDCCPKDRAIGPRWVLYEVDNGVYLQALSSISANNPYEISRPSERLRLWAKTLRIKLVEIEVGLSLLELRKVPSLDFVISSCIGNDCKGVDLASFVEIVARESIKVLGENSMTLLVGNPRVDNVEGFILWVPAASPVCIEAIDRALSNLGIRSLRRCRAIIGIESTSVGGASPYSAYPKQPILAPLRDVCKEVEISIG